MIDRLAHVDRWISHYANLRFCQRNRLIAASSLATMVIEAGWRSGSLNTAHHALSLSRPVGAVPGPVTSAASAGCHKLIRESLVTCVTSAEEMAELAPLGGPSPGPGDGPATAREDAGSASSNPTTARVVDALSSRSPREASDIATRSGLSIGDVRAELGRMLLDGAVREGERGWTRRTQPLQKPGQSREAE